MQNPQYEEFKVQDFDDLLKKVTADYPCGHWVYRGVGNADHQLVASLGRIGRYKNALDENKRDCWEKHFITKSYDANNPNQSEFENDFLSAVTAQHHGAPTRFLDWTRSPLIATLFATEVKIDAEGQLKNADSDCAVFGAHICPDESDRSCRLAKVPFAMPLVGTYLVDPPATKPRVIAQQSVFTISPDATVPLEKQPSDLITKIHKYIIPKDKILDFQKKLFRLGIRKGSLFPEADGLNTTLVAEVELKELLCSDCNL